MGEVLGPMVATFLIIFGTVWIVRTVSTNRRLDRLAKMHNELQARVLDKLSSAPEMLEVLRTEPGTSLLGAPAGESGKPYARIIGSVQIGIILTLGGAAFLAMSGIAGIDDPAVSALGVMGLFLGVGFLISAAAAHVLSKSYGLIDGHGRATE